ncbi:MAG: lamin tail domain-containing protein [Halioglobus sp.]|nr:lamin tail domain-containing protein [Halioglobus sp.]
MPELQASGELLQANGQAGFETGILHGEIAAGVKIGVTAEAEVCHGVDVEIGAGARAEIHALLALLLPALRAEGHAFASAGAGLNLQLSPNLFDRVGFTARAQAQAQASVGGRVAIGMDFHSLSTLAREQLPSNLANDIFIAFLNELIVEGGVWGKASFSAMARAQLQVAGSLASDEGSRFVIAAGGEVGWGGGTGWDFYCGLQFKDVKRFYHTAAHLVTDEVVREARTRLPERYRPLIELTDLLLPTALVAAFELGQMSALELVRWAEQADQNAAPFGRAFQRQLQRFVFDKLALAAGLLLARYLDGLLMRVTAASVPADRQGALRDTIEELIDSLQTNGVNVAQFPALAAGIGDIVTVLYPAELRHWRRPLTIAWCALTLGEAARIAGSSASATAGISVGVVGLGGIGGSASIAAIAQPPQLIRDELDRHFDPAPEVIAPSDAVDYLLQTGLAPLLEDMLPELAEMLETLSGLLGGLDLSPGDLVETALRGAAGEDLTDTELYQNLRDWMKTSIETKIVGELMPALRAELDASDDALLYIDEVAEPGLLLTSRFVFRSLDRVVQVANRPAPGSEFYDTFKTGLSALVWRLFARNVVVISDILTHHTVTQLHTAFTTLHAEIAANPHHPFVSNGQHLLRTLAPHLDAYPDDTRVAVHGLFADLVEAGALAFGPAVWTESRRVQMRSLMIRLLESISGELDLSDGDALYAFFDQLRQCFFVPELDTLEALSALLGEVTLEELQIVFERVVPALKIFWLRLTLTSVEEMERDAHAWIDGMANDLREAWEAWQYWIGEAGRLRELLQERIAASGAALTAVGDALSSDALQDAAIEKARSDGLANAESIARTAPGFGLLDDAAQAAAIGTAQAAFLTAFVVLEPLLRTPLSVFGAIVGAMGDMVSIGATLPDAVEATASAAASQYRAALESSGIAWPDALGLDDVADAAHKAVSNAASVNLALTQWLAARLDERDARGQAEAAASERDVTQERHANESARYADVLGGPLTLHIHSPHALATTPQANWLYPREVPVYIEVIGARPSFVEAVAPQRLLITVNGQTLPLSASAWTFDENRQALHLRHTLTATNSALRDGLNSIELSVVNGIDQRARHQASFVVDTALEAQPGRLEIAGDLSQFDAPGSDHANASEEYVTLRNAGDRAIDLTGWELADAAGHRFRVPTFELQAAATVRIRTGKGSNDAGNLYWGRTQAVWNNRGDAIYLIDASRVLRAEHVY